MSNEKTYLQTRVFDAMGLTPTQCKIKLRYNDRFEGMEREVVTDIFTSTKDDDINIAVYDIERNAIEYIDDNGPKVNDFTDCIAWKQYKVTRLNPTREKDGVKYINPKGLGTYPFFPPKLVEAYEQKKEIRTLYMTEGYFKAMKASECGFPIIGVTGINNIKNKEKQLYPDIWKIIKQCKVKNIAFIYDGDCANISTKAIEAKQDLRIRPNSFLMAGLQFKECFATSNINAYWINILSDQLEGNPKGLDDLLLQFPKKKREILKDADELNSIGTYFYHLNLTSFSTKLSRHLNISSVESFYEKWADVIQGREFVFGGSHYQYNEEEKIVQTILPKGLKNIFRIADDYYELQKRPNIFYKDLDDDTKFDRVLVMRKREALKEDYKQFPNALQKVQKFKGFINLPDNENYRREIFGYFNMYQELKYTPVDGDCPTILNFLNHIFQEHIEYGLDYLKLIYERPTQMLPILCLVSEERKTGKDTFLNLLHEIYGDNCRVCGNAEIQSDFNTYFAGKLIVGINETDLHDNKGMTEKLKMWSTAKKVSFTGKGKDSQEIDNFTKYIICSNNVKNFIYTDKNEIRFWIRDIQSVKQEDPFLLEKMCEEIPQFLFFLKNRKMKVQKALTRSWFDTDMLRTEALKRLIAHQRPKLEIIITDYLRDYFIMFKQSTVRHTVSSLKENIPDLQRIEDFKIRRILQDNMKMQPSGANSKFSVKRNTIDSNGNPYVDERKYTGRYFEFYAKNYLTDAELLELSEYCQEELF